ncbi:hypothetical protein F511_20420 [Dorcoceras hygrometricum]|uniref:Uncharacterized protein n=1 Tax=Dorcoceras hygrometricum TaxID=472368 RepID=A0A2Z7AY99_9LAMI|nr:hypothetical protein F511_20420 [Dorcoceras hygrometricum]
MSCARWTVPEGVALASCENMQVGSDVHEGGSAGASEPAEVDVKRNLESATMTSAFLLEEVVISNYDVSFISRQQAAISNYDVSNISRQLDGSAMITSAVMSSQSAVEQKQYQQAVKDETASYYYRSC